MKLIKKSNFRVVVEPTTHIFGFALPEDTVQSNLKEIEAQIKRHIDNVEHIGIEYDKDEVCSYCNLTWEVSEDDSDPDFPKGCPVCCQDAIDEWKASKPNSNPELIKQ